MDGLPETLLLLIGQSLKGGELLFEMVDHDPLLTLWNFPACRLAGAIQVCVLKTTLDALLGHAGFSMGLRNCLSISHGNPPVVFVTTETTFVRMVIKFVSYTVFVPTCTSIDLKYFT
jgi:hypothetical protein